ncbi:MAG: hypothetical protein ABSB24_05865 [Gaiellaceae bacterium]
MAVFSSDAFELAHTPFDAPDVQALALAQQKELRGRYDGVGDIGPAREAAMFKPPHGVFLLGTIEGRVVACGGVCRFDETRAELKRMYVALRADPLLRRVRGAEHEQVL